MIGRTKEINKPSAKIWPHGIVAIFVQQSPVPNPAACGAAGSIFNKGTERQELRDGANLLKENLLETLVKWLFDQLWREGIPMSRRDVAVSCFATRLGICQSAMRNLRSLIKSLANVVSRWSRHWCFQYLEIVHNDFLIIPGIVNKNKWIELFPIACTIVLK